jgi:hypothetical protein
VSHCLVSQAGIICIMVLLCLGVSMARFGTFPKWMEIGPGFGMPLQLLIRFEAVRASQYLKRYWGSWQGALAAMNVVVVRGMEGLQYCGSTYFQVTSKYTSRFGHL